MTVLHQLLLAWAMNALWQPMAVYAMAWIANRVCAKKPARFRHWIWLAAAALASLIPLATVWGLWGGQPSTSSGTSLPPSFLNLVAALTLAGVGVRALAVARNLQMAARLSRDAHPVCLTGAHASRTDVRTSWGDDAQLGPLTVGFLKPVIIIPELLLLSTDQRAVKAALAHELAHIQRNDAWLLLTSELFLTLLGFHPVAKAFRSNLSATREMACDEQVVTNHLDAGDYAQALLEVARHTVRSSPVIYGMGAIGGCLLETRIRAIVSLPPGGPRRLPPYQKIAVILWAAALTASMAWSARTLFVWMNPLPVLRRAVDSIPPPPPPIRNLR